MVTFSSRFLVPLALVISVTGCATAVPSQPVPPAKNQLPTDDKTVIPSTNPAPDGQSPDVTKPVATPLVLPDGPLSIKSYDEFMTLAAKAGPVPADKVPTPADLQNLLPTKLTPEQAQNLLIAVPQDKLREEPILKSDATKGNALKPSAIFLGGGFPFIRPFGLGGLGFGPFGLGGIGAFGAGFPFYPFAYGGYPWLAPFPFFRPYFSPFLSPFAFWGGAIAPVLPVPIPVPAPILPPAIPGVGLGLPGPIGGLPLAGGCLPETTVAVAEGCVPGGGAVTTPLPPAQAGQTGLPYRNTQGYPGGPLPGPYGGQLSNPYGGQLSNPYGGQMGSPYGGQLSNPYGGQMGSPYGGQLPNPYGG